MGKQALLLAEIKSDVKEWIVHSYKCMILLLQHKQLVATK